MPFSDLGIVLGDVSLWEVDHFTKDPAAAQNALLRRILRRSRTSEYGRKYDFARIRSIDDYRRMVPLTRYEDYAPYVERMMHGERNLMYTGANLRYCSSSGSVGKPKVLPKGVSDLWKMQCIGFSVSVTTAYHHLKNKGVRLKNQLGPLALNLSGHKTPDGKMSNGAAQIPLRALKPILPFFCTSPLPLLFPNKSATEAIKPTVAAMIIIARIIFSMIIQIPLTVFYLSSQPQHR